MEHNIRPCVQYGIVDYSATHNIKCILFKPTGRPSLQYHKHRAKVWTNIEGSSVVTIDNQKISCVAGQTFIIPLGATPIIENPNSEKVLFREVQHGTYFGEDSIVRIEEDYKII